MKTQSTCMLFRESMSEGHTFLFMPSFYYQEKGLKITPTKKSCCSFVSIGLNSTMYFVPL